MSDADLRMALDRVRGANNYLTNAATTMFDQQPGIIANPDTPFLLPMMKEELSVVEQLTKILRCNINSLEMLIKPSKEEGGANGATGD